MINNPIRAFLLFLLAGLVAACDREHAGETIAEFSGDYRYFSEIGEFFDCGSAQKYYVHNSTGHQAVIAEYQKLGLAPKDDAYVKVKGYFKEFPQMDGLDPETEFVPVEFISIDSTRGCRRSKREGL